MDERRFRLEIVIDSLDDNSDPDGFVCHYSIVLNNQIYWVNYQLVKYQIDQKQMEPILRCWQVDGSNPEDREPRENHNYQG